MKASEVGPMSRSTISRVVLQGTRQESWGGFEGFLGFPSHGI